MSSGRALTFVISVFVFTSLISQGHAQTPNVLGMWLFDEGEGNQVMDSSGNGRTGVAVDGDLEWVEGKVGKALKFSHDGTRVHIDHDNVFNVETFTVECWVKLQSANGDWQTVVAKRTEGVDATFTIEINKADDTPRIAVQRWSMESGTFKRYNSCNG